MEDELIELRKKLLFASKCIREHNDPMAADQVIEFSLVLVNNMIETSGGDKQSTSESVLPIPCVTASAFIDDCANMAEYIDGEGYSAKYKSSRIAVIEYTELNQAAKKFDNEHLCTTVWLSADRLLKFSRNYQITNNF